MRALCELVGSIHPPRLAAQFNPPVIVGEGGCANGPDSPRLKWDL